MKEYDAYIFDLDGTLLDTLQDLASSTNHALSACGMPTRTVDEVRLNDSGSAPYAILTPQSDVSGLTQVAIIKSFDIVT